MSAQESIVERIRREAAEKLAAANAPAAAPEDQKDPEHQLAPAADTLVAEAPKVTLSQEELQALIDAGIARALQTRAPEAAENAPWVEGSNVLMQGAAQVSLAQQSETEGEEFFHSIPGSKFHYQVGPGLLEELMFIGGRVRTANPTALAELRKVADKPGSLIFTAKSRAAQTHLVDGEAAAEAKRIAEIHHQRMVAAGEKTF